MAMRKKILLVLVILIVVGFGVWWSVYRKTLPVTQSTQKQSSQQPSSSFDKHKFSTTDPASIWIIASKVSPLNPLTYAPTDLVTPSVPLRLAASSPEMHVRKQAADAMEQMVADAKKAGANLMLASGYRSYQTQVSVYNNEVAQNGQATADTESARPGHSEHQTGLAADMEPTNKKCELDNCFGDTAEGKWLTANAYKYGFIIRYQPDKVAITGYRYEPWHIRYIGIDLSQEMHKQGITTLEEFFGVVPSEQPY